MKHLRGINESLGNGEETFNVKFEHFDVNVYGMPDDWGDRDLSMEENGTIEWKLSMNLNNQGIEWFSVSVPRIEFNAIFLEDDEEIDFVVEDPKTELLNITQSFYVNAIEVDMEGSKDPKDWKVEVSFGNPT